MKNTDGMTITIRPATLNDVNAVLPLAKAMAQTFVVNDDTFHESFVAILRAKHMRLFVAVDNKVHVVVGYCLAVNHPTFYASGNVAWVEELAVDIAHQRQGIGSALMSAAEQFARNSGCKLLALATRRAGDFYNTLGYEDSATYWRKVLL